MTTEADSMINSAVPLADRDGDMVDDETPEILTPPVITPLNAPKLMDLPMFQGEQKENLYWGTYRPQAYFGVRARDPTPLVAGLMWLVSRDGKPVMRHFCEDKVNLIKSFGWKEHNGIDYGRQELVENEMVLKTSFVKSNLGSLGYGGDWSVRINVEQLAWLDDHKSGTNLFFYIADEEYSNVLNLGLEETSTLVTGSRKDVGNWQLHLKTKTEGLKTHYCGFKTPNSVNLSDLVLKNLAEGVSGLELPDTAEDDSNVYVFQISTTTALSTIDIAFISGMEEETAKMEDRINILTGAPLTRLLEEKHVAFDHKFKECFNLSEEVDPETLKVGKAAIGNMLGGIGYFYGQSKIAYPNHKTNGSLDYWPAGLYTAVPCRAKFPWGFLWDEGFHQMLIWRWDYRISLEIIGHWFDLMNSEGWIPREQILGAEALSKIRKQFVTQHPDIANPPSLLLVFCDLIDGIKTNKFNASQVKEIMSFLGTAFVRLEAWFHWLYSSQKGKKPGSFYWRGRVMKPKELNPQTLASGLDDYPRASNPSNDEMHVDLRCWIYLAADCMKFIAEFLSIKATKEDYSSIVLQLSNFRDLNKLHFDRKDETYLDFGYHTEKPEEEPKLRLVPHVGYVSFFPLMTKLIPPESQILEQQLDLIVNAEKVWSEYGLLSLSRKSSLYMQFNKGKEQLPYWRGPIWMNMHYMILASLLHYSQVDGSYSEKAREVYDNLRSKLISNVAKSYGQTGYIWEHYNQENGNGEGGHGFTGWSALILLIMAEAYPRL